MKLCWKQNMCAVTQAHNIEYLQKNREIEKWILLHVIWKRCSVDDAAANWTNF